MLLSLLGTSLLNGGFSWDTVKNLGIGMVGNLGTAIPGLLGSIGQTGRRLPSYGDTGLGRSLLSTNKVLAETGMMQRQTNILKRARSAQGTISAYLAGRGFEQGGSTAMILADQNISNAMEDIEMTNLETNQRILNAEVKQLQGDYSMLNNFEASYFTYESPVKRFIKESFIQPTIRQNLSELGLKVNKSINKAFQETPKETPKEEVVQEQTESLRLNPNFFQPLISNKWIMPKL